jgi:hypothetical protein
MYKYFILISLFIFIGCEEIIEVELDNAEPQIVIEAKISDAPENNIVSITKSTDFYNPSQFETISGAEIIVNEKSGNKYIFTEQSPGLYKNDLLTANTGMKYTINVNYNGKSYSATSKLNKKLIIDSIAVIGEKRPFRDNLFYEFHCYFKDNPGIKDYARFKVSINGEYEKNIFVYDDRLTDGNEIDFNRFNIRNGNDEEPIKPGDIITMELLTIDEGAFEYFDTLRRVLASAPRGGPGGGTAPANPTTNWNNNALGYFSAFSIDSKTIEIK